MAIFRQVVRELNMIYTIIYIIYRKTSDVIFLKYISLEVTRGHKILKKVKV